MKEKQRCLLSKELEKQSCMESANLGNTILKFEDLKQAKAMLSKNILQNVWCLPEIYAETIKLLESDQTEDFVSQHIKGMAKSGQVSRTLTSIGAEILKTSSSQRCCKDFYNCENKKSSAQSLLARDVDAGSASLTEYQEEFSQRTRARLLKNYILKCSKNSNFEGKKTTNLSEIYPN